ncbi:lamin tail domain-containing protein, partial [Xanthovirga aplysinae]|uniref:lamin tail domain-containing protein n=1 Tax=Xanthovirga aplysinae TaxID=2529853 RepID=UPI0012BBA14B
GSSMILYLGFEKDFKENKNLQLSIRNLYGQNGNYLTTPVQTFFFDTQAPKLKDVDVLSSNQLRLDFEEKLKGSSAEAINHYETEPFLGHPSFVQLINSDSSVILTFSTSFEEEKLYKLQVINLSDLSGNILSRALSTEFIYDKKPPQINSIQMMSMNQLEVNFSEVVNSTVAEVDSLYLVYPIKNRAMSVELYPYDLSTLLLTFEEDFEDYDSLQLVVTKMEDLKNNSTDSLKANFSSKYPNIAKIFPLSRYSILVQFSEPIVTDITGKPENFILNQKDTPIRIEWEEQDPSLLILSFKTPFPEKDPQLLTILEAQDLFNNSSYNLQESFLYNSHVDQIKIINNQAIEVLFDIPLEHNSASDTLHFILEESLHPISAIHNNEEPTKVKLYWKSSFIADKAYELTLSGLIDQYGRQLPESSHTFSFDQSPPVFTKLKSISSHQIRLFFNEGLEKISASAPNHFQLDQNLFPNQIEVEESSVLLSFSEPFLENQSYSLLLQNLEDLSGNVMPDFSFSFIFHPPYQPKYKELVFNEVLSQPADGGFEFVEIYNTTNDTIELQVLTFSDLKTTVRLPESSLPPGAYAVLCKPEAIPFFPDSIHRIGINPWPELNNSEDELSLNNEKGTLIDRLNYSEDWFIEDEKSEGGWSLELIDPQNPCSGNSNWGASTYFSGNTAGFLNSIDGSQQDSQNPIALQAILIDSFNLEILFDEPMDSLGLIQGKYSFEPPLTIQAIQPIGPDFRTLKIHWEEAAKPGKPYQIHLEGIYDCSQKSLSPTSLQFADGIQPNFNELLISEIMASPSEDGSLPYSEYIELYNPVDKVISLKNLLLSDLKTTTVLPDLNIFPNEYLILCSSSNQEKFTPWGKVVGLNNWPSLNKTDDELTLHLADSTLIFHIAYEDSWYNDAIKADGGWSLEMVDTNNPCAGKENWTSTENPQQGTPGLPNSVINELTDHFGPKIQSAMAISPTRLQLNFSEKLHPNFLNLIRINLLEGPAIETITLSYPDLSSLFFELSKPLDSLTTYSLTVEKVKDCLGNASETINITVAIPSTADSLDIVINEILFYPRSGGVRFIEIFNPSTKYFNLKDLSLVGIKADHSSEEISLTEDHLVLPPDGYQVFTTNGEILKADYINADQTTFIALKQFPSLPSDEGNIGLQTGEGIIIDKVNYNEDYHFPLLNEVRGVSLERVNPESPSNDPNNWQSASREEGFATPGYQNSQSRNLDLALGAIKVYPKIFTPGEGPAMISYQFMENDQMGTVKIFTPNGHLIKTLAQNTRLNGKGFFSWDGTSNQGERVKKGYYLILFTIFNLNGERNTFRESIVVGYD